LIWATRSSAAFYNVVSFFITLSAAALAAISNELLPSPSIPKTFFNWLATFLAAEDSAAFPGTGLSFPSFIVPSSSLRLGVS
jgi:hypothetical protein